MFWLTLQQAGTFDADPRSVDMMRFVVEQLTSPGGVVLDLRPGVGAAALGAAIAQRTVLFNRQQGSGGLPGLRDLKNYLERRVSK